MFLFTDISLDLVLTMPFSTLSNRNIQFVDKKSLRRSYIVAKTMPITKLVKLINKKVFAKARLDKNSETFVIYIAILKALLVRITIYLLQTIQILASNLLKIAALKQNKAPIKVPNKYSDFADNFSKKMGLSTTNANQVSPAYNQVQKR